MTFEPLTRTRLLAGQALRLAVEAGTSIQVVRGAVRLRAPPAWLADGVVWPAVTLQEGQAHGLAQAGWIEVRAQGEAEIVHYRPPTRWRAALRAGRRHAALGWRALQAMAGRA